MYCSSRPESYLELVPSRDQDDLIAKNKGRQRASKSQIIFHIGRPHIQCIWPKSCSFTVVQYFLDWKFQSHYEIEV